MSVVDVSAQVRTWALAAAEQQAFGEDFGIDVTCGARATPNGPQVVYSLVMSCPSPLLGMAPLAIMGQLPAARPTAEQVAEAVTMLMRNLRDGAAQLLKANPVKR